jgi:hypothetical protein
MLLVYLFWDLFLLINKLNNKPNIDLPIFLSKPDFVVGMPVRLAKRCLAADMPNALFQEKEKPYLPIVEYFY